VTQRHSADRELRLVVSCSFDVKATDTVILTTMECDLVSSGKTQGSVLANPIKIRSYPLDPFMLGLCYPVFR
jgi:hypothetical protein